MKKTMKLTLSIFTAVMATQIFSLEFIDEADANAYFAQLRQDWQETREELKKGATDDTALRKGILSVYDMGMMPYAKIEDAISYMKEMVIEDEIPPERVTKMIEVLIREKLTAIEKDEADSIDWSATLLLSFFKVFPDYEIEPLLNECLKSKNVIFRNDIMKRYNIIMETTPEPPKKEPVPTITTPPQPEPPPPVIVDEVKQTVHETPPEQPEKTSSNKTLFGVAIITLLAILGGVAVWRKK